MRNNPFLEEDDRDDSPFEWTETPEGQDTKDDWARRYDDLNGAPESEYDR